MKKLNFLAITVLVSLGLTGCSNASNQSATSSDQSTQKVKQVQAKKVAQASDGKSKDTKTTDKKSKTPWNKTKSKELKQAIQKWSSAAGQTYREYDGKKTIKTVGGVTYPTAFSHKKFSIDNHQEIELGWSPNGKNKYEYNVVAIYNRNVKINGWHTTYLFCLHDGQPVVLVDSTTNVDVIPLTVNMDENLNQLFSKIVKEK